MKMHFLDLPSKRTHRSPESNAVSWWPPVMRAFSYTFLELDLSLWLAICAQCGTPPVGSLCSRTFRWVGHDFARAEAWSMACCILFASPLLSFTGASDPPKLLVLISPCEHLLPPEDPSETLTFSSWPNYMQMNTSEDLTLFTLQLW